MKTIENWIEENKVFLKGYYKYYKSCKNLIFKLINSGVCGAKYLPSIFFSESGLTKVPQEILYFLKDTLDKDDIDAIKNKIVGCDAKPVHLLLYMETCLNTNKSSGKLLYITNYYGTYVKPSKNGEGGFYRREGD